MNFVFQFTDFLPVGSTGPKNQDRRASGLTSCQPHFRGLQCTDQSVPGYNAGQSDCQVEFCLRESEAGNSQFAWAVLTSPLLQFCGTQGVAFRKLWDHGQDSSYEAWPDTETKHTTGKSKPTLTSGPIVRLIHQSIAKHRQFENCTFYMAYYFGFALSSGVLFLHLAKLYRSCSSRDKGLLCPFTPEMSGYSSDQFMDPSP